jgi:hypothetical protein
MIVEAAPPQRQWKSGFEVTLVLDEMHGVPSGTNVPIALT